MKATKERGSKCVQPVTYSPKGPVPVSLKRFARQVFGPGVVKAAVNSWSKRSARPARLLAVVLVAAIAARAECSLTARVVSVRSETAAACADCQMKVEIIRAAGCGWPLEDGKIVLGVTERAHNVAPGSRVSLRVLPEKDDDSGAFVRVEVERR